MSKFKARLYEKMQEAKMQRELDLPVVIGRLSILADKFKDESDSTIPLPMEIEERRYKQGKQEAYANAYIELKRLIDDL